MEVEPTREASTQVSEEDLMPVEPSREVGTQTMDDDSNFPLQNNGGYGYENCGKIDKRELDPDQHTNENHNSLVVNSNTKEGEFHNRPYDICNASTSLESTDDSHVASQQQWPTFEKSSIDDCGNKFGSNSTHKRQPAMKPPGSAKRSGKHDFTNSNMLRLQYPTTNYFSDFTAIAENGSEKDISPVCPSLSQKRPIGKRFQKASFPRSNMKNLNKKDKRKTKICTKCGKYFRKDERFSAHVKSNCHPASFKCDKCDERFYWTRDLSKHQMVHTGQKPFKCTLCVGL